jgi:hypothetical protein
MPADEAKAAFRSLLEQQDAGFKPWLMERLQEKFRQEWERQQQQLREQQEAERRRQELLRQDQERQLKLQQAELAARRQQQEAAQRQRQEDGQAHANGQAPRNLGSIPRSQLISPEYIEAFRKALRGKEESEAAVASGEVLTVRVPKPGNGRTQITWQFNTLDRDIQFGVDFEHKQEDGALAVQPIVPITRINAHLEVVTGTHIAEVEGTWLLKFDNSYSYFRGKTVLYRVLCAAV